MECPLCKELKATFCIHLKEPGKCMALVDKLNRGEIGLEDFVKELNSLFSPEEIAEAKAKALAPLKERGYTVNESASA